MRFCMITTFFGAHSFGGDAAYVDRLSRALLRRGHEVHVIHSVDAFETVRAAGSLLPYTPPKGLAIHPLRLGPLSPVWIHQTGRSGRAGATIQKILAEHDFDVVHYHNISLIGGPGLLGLQGGSRRPVKLLTAHEHWLVCPLSTLWKFNRRNCEKPQCVRCAIAAGRPPQWWRATGLLGRAIQQMDALIYPSRHAMLEHTQRGVRHPRLVHLPYFLPPDWAARHPRVLELGRKPRRPYFAAAGRFVKEKGFHELIPQMRRMPDVDLRLAGTGPCEAELRRLAAGAPNVHFHGHLDYPDLARLYSGARAIVVPSLFYETFGYVVLEAMSLGVPAIVRNGGALPELIQASGAGLAYESEAELMNAMRRFANDDELLRDASEKGIRAASTIWSEQGHIDRYFGLIEAVESTRPRTRQDIKKSPARSPVGLSQAAHAR